MTPIRRGQRFRVERRHPKQFDLPLASHPGPLAPGTWTENPGEPIGMFDEPDIARQLRAAEARVFGAEANLAIEREARLKAEQALRDMRRKLYEVWRRSCPVN
jgi:hypothetical protein